MAERKQQNGRQGEEEEVPAFFKNLGSGSPKPRQKFCGMFCPVEGSLENKTIDFDSLSVGRGCNKVVAKQKDVAHLGPDAPSVYSTQSGKGREPSVEFGRKVEIRSATGKEALQNLNDKVGACIERYIYIYIYIYSGGVNSSTLRRGRILSTCSRRLLCPLHACGIPEQQHHLSLCSLQGCDRGAQE